MPGTPMKRNMIARLIEMGRELEIDEDLKLTPDELATAAVADWITGGSSRHGKSPTLLSLADYLGLSPGMVYRYVWGDSARKEAIARARELAAHLLVDQGLEGLDAADPQTASLANSRANFRRWLAGVFNREAYGESKQGAQVISIGQLHLHAHQALKQIAAARETGPKPQDEVIVQNPVVE